MSHSITLKIPQKSPSKSSISQTPICSSCWGIEPQLRKQNDLNLGRQLGVRSFPTLFFMDTVGNKITLSGTKPYAQFEQIMATLNPNALKATYEKTTKSIFNHYATLTTREYATLADITTAEADKILRGLFEQKLLKQYASKNGVLWIGRSFRF
jgi:putative protein-disulfide isomerase